MTLMKSMKLCVVAGAALFSAAVVPAAAQDPVSLDDVLRAARAERAEAAERNREREAEFLRERNQQRARLNQIQGQVNAADARSDQLNLQFEANDNRIVELNQDLEARQGEFGELFGAARAAAAELATQFDNSIISSELPGRTSALRETAESTTLPSVEELENIYLSTLEEMVAQSKTAQYDAQVVNATGERISARITRIGPFVAFSDGDYYTMKSTESGLSLLQQLARNPQTVNAVPNARAVESFNGSGYIPGTIDPSTGSLLDVVILSPTIGERIDQGRLVGRVILVVLAIGLIIGLLKMVTLFFENAAVKGQVRKKKASKGNSLGRVMMAYESNTGADVDTLALKLDDAVLKEIPRLESGLNLVKVFAAVAPLLGLLGTVVGMINTFQAMTLFGTGNPQLMAGGISEALVTTVLGLVAAIPLLLVHAFASASARSVTQTLEEQAAGMIAEHAESRA